MDSTIISDSQEEVEEPVEKKDVVIPIPKIKTDAGEETFPEAVKETAQ